MCVLVRAGLVISVLGDGDVTLFLSSLLFV